MALGGGGSCVLPVYIMALGGVLGLAVVYHGFRGGVLCLAGVYHGFRGGGGSCRCISWL